MRSRSAYHFSFGEFDVRQSALVDGNWYLTNYGDLKPDIDPVWHFFSHGLAEGRSPNRWMDPAWYRTVYRDVADAGANPIVHYLEHGCHEWRDPGPWFSTRRYWARRPAARRAPHPFLYFLEQDALNGANVAPTTAVFLVADGDRGSPLVLAWWHELEMRGYRIAIGEGAPDAAPTPASLRGWFDRRRPQCDPDLTISFNGAGLNSTLARHLGTSLILVSDDVQLAKSVTKSLGSSLAIASSVTSSRTVDASLRPLCRGPATSWYPEPMWSAYLSLPTDDRPIDVAWRLPRSVEQLNEKRPTTAAFVRSSSFRRLRILGSPEQIAAQQLAARHPDIVELRTNCNSFTVRRDFYRSARLARVTPEPLSESEIISDVFVALTAGALPILPYAAASELVSLLGQDIRIPLYKSLEELDAIVRHYLENEAERATYVSESQRRLKALPTFSTRIGELMQHLRRDAPRLRLSK